MTAIQVKLSIHKDLRALLHPRLRDENSFFHRLNRKASIKDVLESLRIPHTEIGVLIVNAQKTDFSYQVRDSDDILLLSPSIPVDPFRPSLLRPKPLKILSFLTDANVAKLCSLLRMAGLDCISPSHQNDAEIAALAVAQDRLLLTRDRDMLKRKIITHGRLIRSCMPDEQLKEVIELYGLQETIRPFSRCMNCNGLLQPIAKEKILHRLEPLTKKYYQAFFHCPGCNKIYWSGSHKTGMGRVLRKALS